MTKFTTLQQMVDYVHNYIMEYENGNTEKIVEKNILYDMMEEELLDIAENVLTEEDMRAWVEAKDDTYLDRLLNERLEDYPGLLEDIKNEVLSEYVSGSEE